MTVRWTVRAATGVRRNELDRRRRDGGIAFGTQQNRQTIPQSCFACQPPLHTGPAGPYIAQPGVARHLARRKGAFPAVLSIPRRTEKVPSSQSRPSRNAPVIPSVAEGSSQSVSAWQRISAKILRLASLPQDDNTAAKHDVRNVLGLEKCRQVSQGRQGTASTHKKTAHRIALYAACQFLQATAERAVLRPRWRRMAEE